MRFVHKRIRRCPRNIAKFPIRHQPIYFREVNQLSWAVTYSVLGKLADSLTGKEKQ